MRISSLCTTVVTVMVVVALMPSAASAQETERVEKTIAMPANGTLRLKNFSGDIHIVGTSGHDIVLKATRRAGREQLDHIKLDISTSGSTVTINANKQDAEWERGRHNNNVVETSFELQVPASASLDVDAFSSDLTIEGIDGDQSLKTFSGDIRVRDPKGPIDAETFSADIVVLVEPNAKGSVSFNTFSGDFDSSIAISSTSHRKRSVEGALPGGAGRRMKFKTFSGDLQIKTR
ncbi:MAG: DUF4097 family beta strand repeat-containing protein [Acidobacteriota bacterium]